MHSIQYCLYTLAILAALIPQPSTAQYPLTEADRSTIAFDLQVDRLMEEMKTEGFLATEQLEGLDLGLGWPFRGMQLGDFQSIAGAVRLPKDSIAINGFVRFVFSSADIGRSFEAKITENARILTFADGSTVYLSKHDEYTPSYMSYRKISDTEFEFLTDQFLNNLQQRDFKTEVLAESWNALPEKPLRIALDTTSNPNLIKQVSEMMPEIPPAAQIFKELSSANTNTLSLAIGFKGQHPLELYSSSGSEDQAENFQSVVNGQLLFAKSQLRGMVANLDLNSPMVKAANEALDKLKAEREGSEVSLHAAVPLEFAMAVFEALMKARASEARQLNNLRQVIIGALNYETANQKFPFVNGKRHVGLSWRVSVSPFVEGPLQFDQAKGPDAPENAKFSQQMPECFGENNKSQIRWVKSDVRGFGAIADGSSNTICLIYDPNISSPWLETDDISQKDAVKLIKSLGPGEKINVAFYSGSVHTLDNQIEEETLKNLMNPHDGNAVDFP